MADLGIVLPMFTIELDLDLKKLEAIGLSAVLAGAIGPRQMNENPSIP